MPYGDENITAFVCDSNKYDNGVDFYYSIYSNFSITHDKPALFKFYKDLRLDDDNGTNIVGGRIKFPSWACSYQRAITDNQTTC